MYSDIVQALQIITDQVVSDIQGALVSETPFFLPIFTLFRWLTSASRTWTHLQWSSSRLQSS
jgi:hypothetical protein